MHPSRILLDYGSGGKASHRLIHDLFLRHFGNDILNAMDDAALLDISGPVAMSTDTFTVDPIFFPGGDIGALAVHGTVNDVAMLGARPRFLSCAFILEEGLPFADLERVVFSIGQSARLAQVAIVTGDTKVVPKGMVDKIFINTTGLGEIVVPNPPRGNRACPGDVILVSGTVGDHGLAILAQREGLAFEAPLASDCASLHHLLLRLLAEIPEIHVLRDPTRGGLATTINEIAGQSAVHCALLENDIPVRAEVRDGCSFLGLDPLYLANEGKFLCILPEEFAQKALEILRADSLGRGAACIGRVLGGEAGRVTLTTPLGGSRLLDMLEGEQLPRIC